MGGRSIHYYILCLLETHFSLPHATALASARTRLRRQRFLRDGGMLCHFYLKGARTEVDTYGRALYTRSICPTVGDPAVVKYRRALEREYFFCRGGNRPLRFAHLGGGLSYLLEMYPTVDAAQCLSECSCAPEQHSIHILAPLADPMVGRRIASANILR